MTSPTVDEEPDSRTSSVGRKRGYNELSAADDTVIPIEEDSSDEDNQPQEKRARYTEGGEVDDRQLNSTTESSADVVIISDSSGSSYSRGEYESTVSAEDILRESSGNVDAGSTIDPRPTWNPGVSVAIRTSLTDFTPETQFLSTQLVVDPQTRASLEVDTAAAFIDAPKTVSPKQSLDGDEFGTGAATNSRPDQLVHTRSKSETKREFQRLNKYKKKLERKLERETKEGPGPPEEGAKWQTNRSIKRAKILAQLPSSFGIPSRQKEAEEIIKGLPEASKDLMPRDVADTAFNFTKMGRTFKLPQRLHKDLPVVSLGKLSFRHPLHSFVTAFLEENQSILEVVDYELLVTAFQEYLKLLYGHLPERLISIVCSNKQVVGPKAETGCLKLLDEARKEVLRRADLDKAHHQNQMQQAEATRVELRKTQVQVAEARQARKVAREEDEKARKAAKEARRAEKKNSTQSQTYMVSKPPESRIPRIDSPKEHSTTLDSQCYEMAQKSQDLKPYSMGRLLGTKRAQSQAMNSATTSRTHATMQKPSDERQLMRNEERNSETISDIPHTSDQAGAEQKPANNHLTNPELIRRYHPFSDGSPIVHYCLTCAQTDHETLDCPSLTCTNCNLYGVHFTEGCPRRQRCTKCHERGHQKSECPEQLAATADESLRCDICSSSKHLESACHFLWRSFKPSVLKTTKLVADIPIHCYACGAAGHFGSECGIRHSPLNTEGYSWSIGNWKRYVDPQSHIRALSAGKDFSLPPSMKGKKSFNIRGTAQNGAIAPKDDDENIPFIHERVTKPTRAVPRGTQHIKFDQTRHGDNNYAPPHLGSSLPDSRDQLSRAARAGPQQKAYAEGQQELSYRPRGDSARYMRERSFSPPPRFHEERYPHRPGDDYYRMGESLDSYRPYDRGSGSFNIPVRAPESHGNHNQGPARGGLAQRGPRGTGAPRGKRQRNRKG